MHRTRHQPITVPEDIGEGVGKGVSKRAGVGLSWCVGVGGALVRFFHFAYIINLIFSFLDRITLFQKKLDIDLKHVHDTY